MTPNKLNQLADQQAQQFADIAAQTAFKIFRNKKYRQLMGLDDMSQTESDRIFNELVLIGLTMTMLLLEAPNLTQDDDLKTYFHQVSDKLSKAYTDKLKDIGVDRKHRRLWQKLTKMRYNEYSKDKPKAREAAMEIESMKNDEPTIKELEGIDLVLPLQTAVIGGHHHICRSKTKGKDEAFKYLIKQYGKTYVELRIALLGGKITWAHKLRVQIMKFTGIEV